LSFKPHSVKRVKNFDTIKKLMTLLILRKTFCLFIVIFLVSSCKSSSEKSPTPPVEVTTVIVERENIPQVFESVGYAASSHPVEIRARVEGYLEEISYVEGDKVKNGQVMFTLDQRTFVAALEQAQAMLAREKALLWNARQAVDRLTPLYAKHAASKKDLDDATAALLASQASVDAAKANVDTAAINLSYTVIASPIDGLAGKSNFRQGALISPGPNNLLTNVDTMDPIWVYFNASDNQRLKIEKDVKNHTLILPKDDNFDVEVILSDGSLFPGRGKVNFFAPTYDQRTGTLSLRAQLPNPNNLIRPGQFLRVKVMGGVRPNAIYVPQKALLEGTNGMYVYVVREGKAAIQNVDTGDWYGDNWIITEGLEVGDQVIVDGVNKVGQGSPVKVTKQLKLSKNVSETTTTPTSIHD
jgi:membrane fusion protein, multidrug efflux system